jgi:D-serine deaminase-like pyridoxal phosphate-dependent protein
MDLQIEPYRIAGVEDAITPALVIYSDIVNANVEEMLRLTAGAAGWRPHVKTAKLAFVIAQLVKHGVANVKCSTTLELSTALAAGASDVLVAYPMVGTNARRIREIAASFPSARVSVLVENEAQAATWRNSPIGMFIDVNPGMNRTGIGQERIDAVIALAQAAGAALRGLHYYDGHVTHPDPVERCRIAYAGYDRLMELIAAARAAGIRIEEVVSSGTPAFPCGLSYPGFRNAGFAYRVSPGTVVYNDLSSLQQLPVGSAFRPAALVVATMVSRPLPNLITCNAGHKSVSADAGVPTCAAIGWPGLTPLKPSEEHLPIEIAAGSPAPEIGDTLYLLPRHVCPTVNNFDHALIVEHGRILRVECVTARGHEIPWKL